MSSSIAGPAVPTMTLRVPGRLPTKTADQALRDAHAATAMPEGSYMDRFFMDNTPRTSIASITANLGMDASTELVWRKYLSNALVGAPTELAARQGVLARMREGKLPSQLQKTMMARSLSFWRSTQAQKSETSEALDKANSAIFARCAKALGDAMDLADEKGTPGVPVDAGAMEGFIDTFGVEILGQVIVMLVSDGLAHFDGYRLTRAANGGPPTLTADFGDLDKGGETSMTTSPRAATRATPATIGRTASGRPIYSNHPAGAAGYTHADHADAAAAHEAHATLTSGTERKHHQYLAGYHSNRAQATAKSERLVLNLSKSNPAPQGHTKEVSMSLSKAGSGEGTRGGHIIGHTQSGKPIYSAVGGHAPAAYKHVGSSTKTENQQGRSVHDAMPHYSAQDHRDAQQAHDKEATRFEQSNNHPEEYAAAGKKAAAASEAHRYAAQTKSIAEKAPIKDGHIGKTSSGKQVPEKHSMYATQGDLTKLGKNTRAGTRGWSSQDHAEAHDMHERAGNQSQAMAHGEAARQLEAIGKSMNMTKSDAAAELQAYLAKGMSGGLKTIDEPDEDDLYDNPVNGGDGMRSAKDDGGAGELNEGGAPKPQKKIVRNAGDAKGAGNSGDAGNDYRSGVPSPPTEDITYKKSEYTAQELQHQVAHRNALGMQKSIEARRGGQDVVVGYGLGEQRPDAPPMAKSRYRQRGIVTEMDTGLDARASMLAKGELPYNTEAPGMGPRHGQLTKSRLCKSCNSLHSAVFTACPSCGTGSLMQKSEHSSRGVQGIIGQPAAMGGGLVPATHQDLYAPTLDLNPKG